MGNDMANVAQTAGVDEGVSYVTLADEIYHEGNVRDYVHSILGNEVEALDRYSAHKQLVCDSKYDAVEFKGKDRYCESTVGFRAKGLYLHLMAVEFDVSTQTEAEALAAEIEPLVKGISHLINGDKDALDYYFEDQVNAFCQKVNNSVEDTGDVDIPDTGALALDLGHAYKNDPRLKSTCEDR